MENPTLLKIIIILATVAAAILVVRIGFTFDINAGLKAKSEREKDRLRVLCPHTELIRMDDGNVGFESLFHSPFGTTDYICSRC